jgi:hypothetical protein
VTIIEPAGNDPAGLGNTDGADADEDAGGEAADGRRLGLVAGIVEGATVGAALRIPGVIGTSVALADELGALEVHALNTNAVTSMAAARDRDKGSPRAAVCD